MVSDSFQPDARHLVDAALNRSAARLPLYEHGFDAQVVEKVIGEPVVPLLESGYEDHVEGCRRLCKCGMMLGYDCIPFERHVCQLVQQFKGLMGEADSMIKTMDDLDAFPWEAKVSEFIQRFDPQYAALREALPEGMKAVGGIGNGPFETVQDFVPFEELVYLQADEPEVFALLWQRVGDLIFALWEWLLNHHGDTFAVCRFGDDLGFRSSTLLQPEVIRRHILPQYKRIVDLVHSYDKPFLLHSCGKIYDVMDGLIDEVGIDAKHSNEDAIDTFDVWVDRYGDHIGNFGGVDMNVMTVNTPAEVRQYVLDLLPKLEGKGGLAIGTGNQISDYTNPENWVAMCQAVRDWRGESS